MKPATPLALPIAKATLAWSLLTMGAVLLGSAAARALAVLGFVIAVPFGLLIAKVSGAWSFVTAASVHLGSGPLRAVTLLVFLIAVPGTAMIGWLQLEDRAAVASLTLAVSISVGIVAGETMVWIHQWKPYVAFWCVAISSVISLAFQIARFSRRARLEQLR